MSLRSFARRTLLAVALGAVATIATSASAQTPIPGLPGLPPGIPIPGQPPPNVGGIPIPPGIPIPGQPAPPSIPGLPGVPGVPGMPGLPSIPAPGGTIAIPSIPGFPGLKLFSPTGALLMPFMKDETQKIYTKLKTALPNDRRAGVESIPLQTEPSREEINAFAGCDDSGKTFVVITEGMYQVVDLMTQARATDEIFSTSYYDEYVKELAKQQEGKAQVLPLPPGMLDPTKSLDQRKLSRQVQLFQEAMGYVIGHELAHHYLGHLGSACGGGAGGQYKVGDIVRAARKVLPAINQANEIASDTAGIENVLNAGQAETNYHWNEGGGLLVIDFFKKLKDLHPGAPLFTFMMTHPAPEIRKPIVEATAKFWRFRNPNAKVGGGTTGSSPTPGLPGLPSLPGMPKLQIPGVTFPGAPSH